MRKYERNIFHRRRNKFTFGDKFGLMAMTRRSRNEKWKPNTELHNISFVHKNFWRRLPFWSNNNGKTVMRGQTKYQLEFGVFILKHKVIEEWKYYHLFVRIKVATQCFLVGHSIRCTLNILPFFRFWGRTLIVSSDVLCKLRIMSSTIERGKLKANNSKRDEINPRERINWETNNFPDESISKCTSIQCFHLKFAKTYCLDWLCKQEKY